MTQAAPVRCSATGARYRVPAIHDEAGLFLAIAAASLGSAVWLLHRRTT